MGTKSKALNKNLSLPKSGKHKISYFLGVPVCSGVSQAASKVLSMLYFRNIKQIFRSCLRACLIFLSSVNFMIKFLKFCIAKKY
jgi:hypothetical protein